MTSRSKTLATRRAMEERRKRKSKMDTALAIEDVMSASEKELFLQRFLKINPRWRGAHVADVIDTLDNSDTFVDLVEALMEKHERKHGKLKNSRLFGSAVRACAFVYDEVTLERVVELMNRVKV